MVNKAPSGHNMEEQLYNLHQTLELDTSKLVMELNEESIRNTKQAIQQREVEFESIYINDALTLNSELRLVPEGTRKSNQSSEYLPSDSNSDYSGDDSFKPKLLKPSKEPYKLRDEPKYYFSRNENNTISRKEKQSYKSTPRQGNQPKLTSLRMQQRFQAEQIMSAKKLQKGLKNNLKKPRKTIMKPRQRKYIKKVNENPISIKSSTSDSQKSIKTVPHPGVIRNNKDFKRKQKASGDIQQVSSGEQVITSHLISNDQEEINKVLIEIATECEEAKEPNLEGDDMYMDINSEIKTHPDPTPTEKESDGQFTNAMIQNYMELINNKIDTINRGETKIHQELFDLVNMYTKYYRMLLEYNEKLRLQAEAEVAEEVRMNSQAVKLKENSQNSDDNDINETTNETLNPAQNSSDNGNNANIFIGNSLPSGAPNNADRHTQDPSTEFMKHTQESQKPNNEHHFAQKLNPDMPGYSYFNDLPLDIKTEIKKMRKEGYEYDHNYDNIKDPQSKKKDTIFDRIDSKIAYALRYRDKEN